jgi:hypothetical protein
MKYILKAIYILRSHRCLTYYRFVVYSIFYAKPNQMYVFAAHTYTHNINIKQNAKRRRGRKNKHLKAAMAFIGRQVIHTSNRLRAEERKNIQKDKKLLSVYISHCLRSHLWPLCMSRTICVRLFGRVLVCTRVYK